MKKTPSALKWLAEKRARVANDTMQTGRMVQELTERHQRLQTQLAALDETIKVYDRTIDPTSIAPVAAWQGRYGKRGVMRGALVEILEQHSPDWVSSELIERALIAKFAIAFVSPAHRKRWHKQSFGSALQRLVNDGTAERLHDPEVKTGKHGYWRLKQPEKITLAEL